MMTAFRGWSLGCVISGVLLTSLPLQAQENEGVVRLGAHSATGVVRISDQVQPVQYMRGQSAEEGTVATGENASEVAPVNCEVESPGTATCPPSTDVVCEHEAGLPWKVAAWIHNDLARKGAWFRGKCSNGHSGHGGHQNRGGHDGPGRPLAGCYSIVYPVDPGYFDQRDGQIYAAPGYGGPVSVPLAPVVNSTYNYGWGIPSSRLTPVLHPATQAPVSQIPSPYPMAPVSY